MIDLLFHMTQLIDTNRKSHHAKKQPTVSTNQEYIGKMTGAFT